MKNSVNQNLVFPRSIPITSSDPIHVAALATVESAQKVEAKAKALASQAGTAAGISTNKAKEAYAVALTDQNKADKSYALANGLQARANEDGELAISAAETATSAALEVEAAWAKIPSLADSLVANMALPTADEMAAQLILDTSVAAFGSP